MNEFYKGKKVLVTGHTGFKGSWLSQILLSFGAEVVGVSLPAEDRSLFRTLNLENKTKSYFVDIRDSQGFLNVMQGEKPEIVFHLAAQALVVRGYEDPLGTIASNVIGTANVLQAVATVSSVKSVVIVTTDKVYENREWVYPYRENDALGGYDPYSASKAAADIVANSYIRSFFNPADFGTKHNTLVSIVRAGNVIGGGDWAAHRLVPDIVRSIFEKNESVAIRNPKSVRPWEHVMEPLSGYLALARSLYEGNREHSDAWNFGPDAESFVTVEKITKEAIRIFGKGTVQIVPSEHGHEAKLLKLDTTKAKAELGWAPKFDIDKNLQQTFEWYRKYYENPQAIEEFTNRQIGDFFGTN